MGTQTETPAKRISSIVTIVIIVVLVFSIVVLYQGWEAFQAGEDLWGYYVIIGFVGLALSAYMLLQTRRRMQKFTLETQPINTTITCSKCGFKEVRNFERGDYILKDFGQCTKCEGNLMVSAIYREAAEKKKEEKIFT
ncbi:MAG: hypothetical protein ACLFU9_07615 [Candidatus Bathyarchaeia archaeon]